MKMQDIWILFCGQLNCSSISTTDPCAPQLVLVIHPSSCVNHAAIIFVDILLLAVLLSNIIYKISLKKIIETQASVHRFSILQIAFNGCLGLVYIGLGIWILKEKLRKGCSASPIHWWVLYLFQGFTWVLLGLTTSLKGEYFPKALFRFLSIFAIFAAGIFCLLALSAAIGDHQATVKVVLDFLSFVGASLLLICAYKGYNVEGNGVPNSEANGSSNVNSAAKASSFAKAGLFSRLTYWWLNPLMKLGKQKILEEEDIPRLQEADRAEFCYLRFMNELSKQQPDDRSSQTSMLWTIIACHWNDILLSGFFALLKIITLSAGPLLLHSFIEVAQGKQAYKHEGYLLVVALFISKNIESLSQRQWYFRSRLIGLKVRSLLTAVIYKKQLRLSNAAKMTHSSGEIMNYVIVDAYRIGEFPFWSHQLWTPCLQLCFGLIILAYSVGLATVAALTVIVIIALINTPLTKLQHTYQSKVMVAQAARLRACSEALVNMKVLKMYAWETHFKDVIEGLRKAEIKWLSAQQLQRTYNNFLFWLSPHVVSAATLGACYVLKVPLHASNVFTFLATLNLVQEPIRNIPEVINVAIQAKVSFARIVKFLEAPELQGDNVRQKNKDSSNHAKHAIMMRSVTLSWEVNQSKAKRQSIDLVIQPGEKVAVCGEVGSGKSTLLAAILGEVPYTNGSVEVYGMIAYVSQTAWIQTGTIRDNVLFGSTMDELKYQETLWTCSLLKDLELLPYGDMTEIGERGVNLSGGQKQRIQLARALYQDADIYLLDDPFSAVDAHTASCLFREYILKALSEKTVLLVTHQVEFLPAFHCCTLMSDGGILRTGSYHELLASSQEFLELVNAHKETVGTEKLPEVGPSARYNYCTGEIQRTHVENQYEASEGEQLIKQEEREKGDAGLKPYMLYLSQNKGYWYLSIAALCHLTSLTGQTLQSTWMASNVEDPKVSTLKLIVVYLIIGASSTFFSLIRNLLAVTLGKKASESLFSQLINSLFCAPMYFYDATPLGRIMSRVSSDLSIVDLDVPFSLIFTIAATTNVFATLGVLTVITWQILFVSLPVIFMVIQLQRYYFAAAKELMRINGTTKSLVTNHLAESIAGAMIIRAYEVEKQFFAKTMDLIDTNASPFFHNFAAKEWLIQRLETLCTTILTVAALCIVLLPTGTFSPGFIGMAIAYGLSLNITMVYSVQNQCTLANYIICMERLDQYMHVPSEAPQVITETRPPKNWPLVGKVEICNLKIRYRPDTPLVLKGISCTIEGGAKIGIVGRTGSGKTTLIGALFRLVEPTEGKIIVDGIDICSIGLHDLRSRVGIIPQEPTLFNGTVRFNLDPLCQHNDEELWEVLGKCQLKEVVQEKEQGLDTFVMEDGSNWSMGQRQLFCLGRAILRRSRVLVLDEATASIDNATDTNLQKTIRTEFADCTVITVAHRIPTVMDCNKVLSISDGNLVQYDEPMVLMKRDDSLFGQLVKEYWSHFQFVDQMH